MLFTSIDFAIFLPLVFLIYWALSKHPLKVQNLFLILASYVFYGWWDWRFLSLIVISSLSDFILGNQLGRENHRLKRKLLLSASILINIGILGLFKYFSFFVDSFAQTFSLLGVSLDNDGLLKFVLPVGISFYTFQTLSYTIDVYRKKLEPTRDILSFFAFVSFFPQLVAGPIERATNLLPQFTRRRTFDPQLATDGLRQMLWGLFKKVVIADNCAISVEEIFAHYETYSASTLALGGLLFAVQIYCDFSGYSDIAIGTARLFGFKLMRNFAYPYFSRDIAEFWRRWHISLSTWFRDYLYIPLGGSRGTQFKILRNTIIVFTVSGLWHGANWTFVIWGFLNALYFLPLILRHKNRIHTGTISPQSHIPNLKTVLQIGFTQIQVVMALIMFRAESLTHAINYYLNLLSPSLLSMPEVFPKRLLLIIGLFFIVEWFQRSKAHPLIFNEDKFPRALRWAIYYCLAMMVWWMGGPEQDFIYFQF